MFRTLCLTVILGTSLALLPSFAAAEEQAGTSGETTASAASPAATEAATPPALEAAPESAPVVPPALKPITITFSGDLTSVSASADPASVTVQDRYGVKKEITVPAEAKVAQGTATKALADLKSGDKVTVEYTYDVATGKRTAISITVGEPAAAPAAQ
ncbi:MAG: hypothetical protein HYZ94_02335 [Candidatus Omnitrophica bacterium]|nr:hypothetical protein [Candidatus Omnitrophota bacterium]